ncbi:hypothetical protein ACFP3I_12115 [Chryseobacterium arachidis]|uniref:hypothetical protein n=1 Tax=Chryseobacterium arachidis TaxID=1416778 RepID=UPI00360C117A
MPYTFSRKSAKEANNRKVFTKIKNSKILLALQTEPKFSGSRNNQSLGSRRK